ncbi:MAG: hypothetical protein GYA17_03580, partial [Chloroflexi bacterium]|nr:hypothetical protein [Chloroflexota bacterium]
METPERLEAMKYLLSDVVRFAQWGSSLRLRAYQVDVARAIVESVLHHRGLSFVVMFPRQSGKNELQAQIETYLLTLFSQTEAEIVKVSPTWKPQSLNAMRRLERILNHNLITRRLWHKQSGYIYRVGQARVFFLSGAPEANIVGATASTLLEVDEAQDVQPAKFDKDIGPMAASTNATRVFWGTAWTSRTLLARELRAARAAEQADGRRRVFVLTADQVAAEVPAYGAFVADQVAKLGRSHPMVRTQFYSEEIDAQGGMFPAERLALMQGSHPRQRAPRPGQVYALLLDVAGEDEAARSAAGELSNPGRDLTALTVVEVDLASLGDPLLKAPTYRVVARRQWIGVRHTRLYAELRAQAELWQPRYLVVDATGVGAGLASFLDRALPGKVLPFVFNAATKSRLGWDFLAVIETGRFKDWAPAGAGEDADREAFYRQAQACVMDVQTGPEQRMQWGVP